MWDYIIALLIGAAIPVIINWLNNKEKRKYFELERKEKMKMIAVEKRLEAHQQALKLWYDLRSIIHTSDIDERKKEILESGWGDFHKLFEIIQEEVELEPIKPIEKFTEGEEIIMH